MNQIEDETSQEITDSDLINKVVQQSKEMLLYGPVGLALYLKDTAPTFLKIFIARGRNEVDQKTKGLGEQIESVKTAGAGIVPPSPEMLRALSDGLARARTAAENALGALSVLAQRNPGAKVSDSPHVQPEPSVDQSKDSGKKPTIKADSGESAELMIPDYDGLSAAQIVSLLEGLSLEQRSAVAKYEATHRNRVTILGQIDKLKD